MLSKEQLNGLQDQIDKISSLEQDMDMGAVNSGKFENDFHRFIADIKSILNCDRSSQKENDIFNNLFGNKYLWRTMPKPGSMPTGGDAKKLDELRQIVQKIMEMNSNINPNKKEWSFSTADAFNAQKFIVDTFKKATNNIKIIDNYLDEEIFDYLDILDDNLDIWLITDDKKKMFQKLYKAYIVDHPKRQAKINNQSHDRFLIIDDKEIFALGASLNTIGKKDFMVHKIEVEEEKKKKLQDFENYWNSGLQIV